MYFGFENKFTKFVPKADVGSNFDPTSRPWYSAATENPEEVGWTNLYIDAFGTKTRLFTNIYFLLGLEDVSHFHRLKSDEVWYHQVLILKISSCLRRKNYLFPILNMKKSLKS